MVSLKRYHRDDLDTCQNKQCGHPCPGLVLQPTMNTYIIGRDASTDPNVFYLQNSHVFKVIHDREHEVYLIWESQD